MQQLERLGQENFDGLAADLERLEIDAEFEATGDINVALAEIRAQALQEEVELRGARMATTSRCSTAYRCGHSSTRRCSWAASGTRTGSALVHPGKLADGLRRAAAAAGVRICEYSPARALQPTTDGVSITYRRRAL